MARLAREAADMAEKDPTVKRISLVSFRQGVFLVVPMGPAFKAADGDTVNENGLSPDRARNKAASLFGAGTQLSTEVWERAVLLADAGTKIILELGSRPDPETGKYPILMQGQ